MRVTVLVDDISSTEGIEAEHGLSLFIERGNDRLLFDVGLSGMFARNAMALGCPIERVDSLILSHGHYDHTGGLVDFFTLNQESKIYITPTTFRAYFSMRGNALFQNIGTKRFDRDERLASRFIVNKGVLSPGEGITLFSDVSKISKIPDSNIKLYSWDDSDGVEAPVGVGEFIFPESRIVHDLFLHEQNLVVTTEDGKVALFVGCSHCGIVNILGRSEELLGRAPDYVVGGFHLSIPSLGETISYDQLDLIAEELKRRPCRYYTGHCVSYEAYERLKPILGDQISYFGSGDVIEM